MRAYLHKVFSNPRLPNILTLGRILAVVAIVLGVGLAYEDRGVCVFVALFYLVAALSDLLDGYLARKYKNESNLGRFLDPLADKLLVFSALIMLIPKGLVPAWVAFLIITRELSVTSLRAIAMERGLVISASSQGKMKTLAQNIALFCLLWNGRLIWADTVDVGNVILYVALFITYWSGILYFYNFLRAMGGSSGKDEAPQGPGGTHLVSLDKPGDGEAPGYHTEPPYRKSKTLLRNSQEDYPLKNFLRVLTPRRPGRLARERIRPRPRISSFDDLKKAASKRRANRSQRSR
jgi:CDP-diacylglycerol--glycerol-3-phosphate 3-phosphatidyltransferase